MQKLRKIIYWIATLWLALGLTATGLVQLFHGVDGVGGGNMMSALGYPLYLMPLLGILKLLAAVILLLPGFSLPKQWAYAGVFFLVVGAVYSHIAAGGGIVEVLPALLIGVLTVVSWWLLPDNRKLSLTLSQTSV